MPRRNVHLGQHFLSNPMILSQIVDLVAQQSGSALVEIGPGKGALTNPLLDMGYAIEAIELDLALYDNLQTHHPNLTVMHADALQCDMHTLQAFQSKSVRLFGNLPYQISALLMIKLFHYRSDLKSMTFMVQQEVAERIVAQAGTPHYGRLSVMVQAWCQARIVLSVPPDAFNPPPKVMSSVFIARPIDRPECQALDWGMFEKVVARAFMHKRKQCYRAFKAQIDPVSWKDLGLKDTARPTELTVQDYIALTKWLCGHERPV